MACCLTAPRHYLNQCQLHISELLWHSPQGNLTASAQATLPHDEFYCYTFKILTTFSRITELTHWGRVTHICVSELTIIGSDNGLSPGRRQAIIWNNAGLLLIEPLGTNVSEISIGIQTFSFKKMHLKMSSGKWRPFCLGLNVLMYMASMTYGINEHNLLGIHDDSQSVTQLGLSLTDGLNKMEAILQTTYSYALLGKIMSIFIHISMDVFSSGYINYNMCE